MADEKRDLDRLLHELSEAMFSSSNYLAAFKETTLPLPVASVELLDRAILAVERACATMRLIRTARGR